MRGPNLKALRMFDAAARHLNFRIAADEQNLTQGAVAQQVRALEADLGVVLFKRHARGLALTDTGERYHRSIARALALIDKATQDLRPAEGKVTLSTAPSFAAKWLLPRLAALAEALPDMDLRTIATDALSDFRTDGVDVAIRQGRPKEVEGLTTRLLAPLTLTAVCGADYQSGTFDPDNLAELQGHALIQDDHRYWQSYFEESGIASGNRVLQFNQTALAMEAAANNQGVALVPAILAQRDLQSGRLRAIWQPAGPVDHAFYIVHVDRPPPSATVQALIDWLHGQIERESSETQ